MVVLIGVWIRCDVHCSATSELTQLVALLVQHFVQVHQLVGQHGPGGQRRRVQRRIGLRLADGDQLLRLVGMGLVVGRAGRRATPAPPSSPRRAAAGPATRCAMKSMPASRLVAAVLAAPSGPGCRAASTNCGSFSVTSACSGVLVRSRRTVQISRVGALKMSIDAGGARALPEGVHAAAIQVLAGVAAVIARVAADHGHRLPDAVGLVRLDARAADLAAPAGRWPPGRSRGSSRRPCGSAGRATAAGSAGPSRSFSGVTAAAWR